MSGPVSGSGLTVSEMALRFDLPVMLMFAIPSIGVLLLAVGREGWRSRRRGKA